MRPGKIEICLLQNGGDMVRAAAIPQFLEPIESSKLTQSCRAGVSACGRA
jgi:hypothetical protein